MSLSWLSIAFIIAAAHGIFLLVAFRGQAGQKHPANKFLLLLIFSVVLSLLLRLTYSENNHLFLQFPHLTIAGDFVLFVIGPVLYFYVKNLLNPAFRWQAANNRHFIPLGLFFLSYFYLLSMSRNELLAIHANGDIHIYYILIMSAAILQIGTYAVAGFLMIRRFQNEQGSNSSRLVFLKGILLGFLIVALCWIPGHLYSAFPGFNIVVSNFFYQLSFLVMSALVFLIGFYAIRRPELFKTFAKKSKYRHSSLAPTAAGKIKKQLLHLMETQQPYLDPTLSLKQLAELLEVNQVHLSQVMNEQCGKSFYDLVNEYRVSAFVEKAQSGDYENYTLLAIALESGFQSKTSFNKAFKKIKGSTPSQFLKAKIW